MFSRVQRRCARGVRVRTILRRCSTKLWRERATTIASRPRSKRMKAAKNLLTTLRPKYPDNRRWTTERNALKADSFDVFYKLQDYKWKRVLGTVALGSIAFSTGTHTYDLSFYVVPEAYSVLFNTGFAVACYAVSYFLVGAALRHTTRMRRYETWFEGERCLRIQMTMLGWDGISDVESHDYESE